MKQTKLIIKIGFSACVFAALLFFGYSKAAWAQKNNLSYPIKELGYCRDAKECHLYCEIPENKAACWSYGKYKLYSQVLGEEDEAIEVEAKARGISFPIVELGNCASVSACREYCGNKDNYIACSDFAKKKGFSKDESVDAQTKKTELIKKAKEELGCTTMESCRSLCESQPGRCSEFAKKHGLVDKETGEQLEKRKEFVQKAKEELGCTSEQSCQSYCEQKENRDRCIQFAKKQGFGQPGSEGSSDGGKNLPCNSDETCRKYCQENPNECPGYKEKQEGKSEESRGGGYTGPSGCRNEEECRKWCLENPDKCPGYKQSGDYSRDRLMEKNRQLNSSGSAAPLYTGQPSAGGTPGNVYPSVTGYQPMETRPESKESPPSMINYQQTTPASQTPAGTYQGDDGWATFGTGSS